MAGNVLDTLFIDFKTRATEGLKGLKAVQAALGVTVKATDAAASAIEKSADRVQKALASMGAAAGALREAGRGGGGGGGGSKAEPNKSNYGAGNKFKTGSGQIGDLRKATQDADKLKGKLNEVEGAAKKAAGGLSSMGVAMGNLVSSGIQWVGGKLVGGLESAAQAAIDAESKLKGISKVIDDSSPENIDKISKGIKSLAVELGVMPNEVADLTKELAAAGPEIQKDLLGYAELASKTAVAFELTGKEAGGALASLTASLGLNKDELTSLLGTINQLDAGMNSSSKQLTNYLTEVGGIGRAASISGETMLALGSAIISTGVNEDKAATGVKNFIATLESGTAATDHQLRAFKKLGFEATEVAKEMASGNAEEQIKKISAAIGSLPPEERFATLIDLFGKESIGSVGGLATNVDLLGQSFAIAADKTKSMTSVQKEFDSVSQTTEHQIGKLKASIGVLAIEFGNALLPTIKQVVGFLNSPEGQEWGKKAIETAISGLNKLVEIAKALWPILETVGGVLATMADKMGIATVAVVAFAAKLAILGGPAGALMAVAAVGVAAGYKLGEYLFGPATTAADIFAKKAQEVMSAVLVKINEVLAKTRDAVKESNAALAKENERKTKILNAGFSDAEMTEKAKQAGLAAREKFLKNRKGGNNVKLSDDEADQLRLEIKSAMAQSKLDYMDAAEKAGGGNPVAEAKKAEDLTGKKARFDYLDKNRKSLKPSEQKEYTKLSKELDIRKSKTGGGGSKKKHYPWEHDEDLAKERWAYLEGNREKLTPSEKKEYTALSNFMDVSKSGKMTKEQKQLAAMDPTLAGILKDSAGGVSDDPLTKSVFAAANKGPNDRSVDGEKGNVGPGPNITNEYDNRSFNTNITQEIDARGAGGPVENLAAAARDVGNTTSEFILTGWTKVLADQNSGGAVR